MDATAKPKLIAHASPARLYCTLVGGAVAIAGVIGFFYSSGFDTGIGSVRRGSEDLLGIFAVNGWHNLLHMALGIAGLAAASSAYAARTYSLAVGLAYVLLAIWGLGFDDDGVILGLLPLNDADNVLHLVLGLTGLGAGAATPPVASPKRRRRAERPRRESRARPERSARKSRPEREAKPPRPASSEARAGGARRSRAARRDDGDDEARPPKAR